MTLRLIYSSQQCNVGWLGILVRRLPTMHRHVICIDKQVTFASTTVKTLKMTETKPPVALTKVLFAGTVRKHKQ